MCVGSLCVEEAGTKDPHLHAESLTFIFLTDRGRGQRLRGGEGLVSHTPSLQMQVPKPKQLPL